mmetsp:Transcript_24333/g.50748  ORF Transcript_24333/g.50748 Transcript_24333/m.50748 type:complete len:220 (-) Transcript_24333:864-1523(-)
MKSLSVTHARLLDLDMRSRQRRRRPSWISLMIRRGLGLGEGEVEVDLRLVRLLRVEDLLLVLRRVLLRLRVLRLSLLLPLLLLRRVEEVLLLVPLLHLRQRPPLPHRPRREGSRSGHLRPRRRRHLLPHRHQEEASLLEHPHLHLPPLPPRPPPPLPSLLQATRTRPRRSLLGTLSSERMTSRVILTSSLLWLMSLAKGSLEMSLMSSLARLMLRAWGR